MLNSHTNPFINKHTLYRLENNVIEYVSIKKRFKNEVVVIKGIFEKDYEIKTYKFSSLELANSFQNKLFRELLDTYKYNPIYIPLKIGFDFSNFDEDQITNMFLPFSDFLESHLLISGNGFIPDNFFDEINGKEIYSIKNMNNIYSISFFVINSKITISEINVYLNQNEKIKVIIL